MKHILSALLALALAAALFGCSNGPPLPPPEPPAQPEQAAQPEPPAQPQQPEQPPESSQAAEPVQSQEAAAVQPATGTVTVTFDYTRQSGSASNQFAIWVEDMDGGYVRTLYATRYTVNGGFERRPDSIPVWVAKSGLANMGGAEADAVTSATPRESALSYAWDLTDKDGNTVPQGEYKILVEGTLRWKNQVLCSGVVDLAGEAADIELAPAFTFAGADNQPALTPESPEAAMITSARASYTP